VRAFSLPTKTFIAPGCRDRLPLVLACLEVNAVLLVTDQGLAATAWPQRIVTQLRRLDISVELEENVEENPRCDTVERVARRAAEGQAQAVIGLGGGSVLDCAKAAAMLATNGGTAHSWVGRQRFPKQPLPVVAIPTTCGTGSEVTWVSVLTHTPTLSKISIKGPAMFPEYALVDADLLTTLPAQLVTFTALDALTHALEAIICTAANPVSDAVAQASVSKLIHYLPRAAADIAEDGAAREAVMMASTLAGIAFGNADVAGVHCLSETLGGLYDIPHGLANAVLLCPVLRFHRKAIIPQLAQLNLLCHPDDRANRRREDAAASFLSRLEELASSIGVPTFASLGISPGHYSEIAKRAAANGSNGSNPQPMDVPQYMSILESLQRSHRS